MAKIETVGFLSGQRLERRLFEQTEFGVVLDRKRERGMIVKGLPPQRFQSGSRYGLPFDKQHPTYLRYGGDGAALSTEAGDEGDWYPEALYDEDKTDEDTDGVMDVVQDTLTMLDHASGYKALRDSQDPKRHGANPSSLQIMQLAVTLAVLGVMLLFFMTYFSSHGVPNPADAVKGLTY